MGILFHSNIYNTKKLFSLDFDTNQQAVPSKKIFNIPFYQRDYVWTKENAGKLIDDIISAEKRGAERYFLGGIVLCAKSISDNNDFIDVVDGQQRIMTTAILLAVLYNFLEKNRDSYKEKVTTDQEKSNIDAVYEDNYKPLKKLIVNSQTVLGSDTKRFYKVNTSNGIKAPFEDFIEFAVEKNKNNKFNELELYEAKVDSDNRLTCENITSVAIEIQEALKENFKSIESVNEFINFLNEKLTFVVTITDDLDTAFQIFETLNDRGVSLSPDDLIKSYIIKNSGGRYELLAKKWDLFLDELKDDKGRYVVKPLDFFDWIFLSEGMVITEEKIFSQFREYSESNNIFKSPGSIESYLDELLSYAKFFRKSEKDHPGIKKISFTNGHSTLLALHKIKNNKEQVNKFIAQIERFAITYFISGKTKEIKYHLAKINKILHDGLPSLKIPDEVVDHASFEKNKKNQISTTYKEYVSEIDKYIKNNAKDFSIILESLYFPKSGKKYQQATYILSKIAYCLGGVSFDLTSKNTTIEHIMPWKDIGEHYADIESEVYDKLKGRIGNMTIMNKDFNGSLGSDSFLLKLEAIKNAQLDYFTSSLSDSSFGKEKTYSKYRKKFDYTSVNKWGEEEINKRSAAIARVAKYIFVEGNIKTD